MFRNDCNILYNDSTHQTRKQMFSFSSRYFPNGVYKTTGFEKYLEILKVMPITRP